MSKRQRDHILETAKAEYAEAKTIAAVNAITDKWVEAVSLVSLQHPHVRLEQKSRVASIDDDAVSAADAEKYGIDDDMKKQAAEYRKEHGSALVKDNFKLEDNE